MFQNLTIGRRLTSNGQNIKMSATKKSFSHDFTYTLEIKSMKWKESCCYITIKKCPSLSQPQQYLFWEIQTENKDNRKILNITSGFKTFSCSDTH